VAPWIFINDTDKVEGSLVVLFLGLVFFRLRQVVTGGSLNSETEKVFSLSPGGGTEINEQVRRNKQ